MLAAVPLHRPRQLKVVGLRNELMARSCLIAGPRLRQLSDLGMERLQVDGRLRASVAAARTEHIGCPFLRGRM